MKRDWGKWSRAKKRYLRWFEETYDYVHCLNEECDDPNHAPHDVHHIVARSKAPNSDNLHHKDNLIMLCNVCHGKFHFAKSKDDHRQARQWAKRWIQERGLNQLFGKIK
jgi:5-methylcytosine-specific restriction endonuclease McrA